MMASVGKAAPEILGLEWVPNDVYHHHCSEGLIQELSEDPGRGIPDDRLLEVWGITIKEIEPRAPVESGRKIILRRRVAGMVLHGD